MHLLIPFLALASPILAGTITWDGRFNDYTTSSDLDKWSWSNQILSYQWYIHGSSPTAKYINFSPFFANPIDTASHQGAKITIDDTSSWNGQTMMRTELIPQANSDAGINKGKKFYHFSVKHEEDNAPDVKFEHQVMFFESHFTELKYGGSSTGAGKLQWYANSQAQASFDFTAGVWHNFVYAIDFEGGSIELYHSTGGEKLAKVGDSVKVSASSNGQDFHVGVLRLPGSEAKEDWFFSGVYIEEGSLTTEVKGPGGSGSSAPASSSAVSAPASSALSTIASTHAPSSATTAVKPIPSTTLATSVKPTISNIASSANKKYAQCGGNGWAGTKDCETGSVCKVLNDYYSQCV